MSLLLLALAAEISALMGPTQGCGYYFLPLPIVRFFARQWLDFVSVVAMAAYLILNRDRSMRRRFGRVTHRRIVAVLLFYRLSLAQDGCTARYINMQVEALFTGGFCSGLLYRLVVVCAQSAEYCSRKTSSSSQTATLYIVFSP